MLSLYQRNESFQTLVLVIQCYACYSVTAPPETRGIFHLTLQILPYGKRVLALILLIPFERFRGGKKGKCLHAFALTFLVCTVNLLWLGHCRIFLNHLGASSPIQLAYILAHPLNYYTTVWRTFLGQGGNLILQTAGLLLGSANVQMSGTLLLPYLFLIAHKANAVSPFASSKDSEGNAGLRAVCTAVLLIITILTFTSVYLHWARVRRKAENTLRGQCHKKEDRSSTETVRSSSISEESAGSDHPSVSG